MQQTLEQLKTMKLTGMVEAWQQQQSSTSFHDLSFDERFTLLVEREYLRRQNQRLKRRLKQARLPMQATLDAVDFDVPRGIRKMQFIEFTQGKWLTERLNLILMGPTGIGKSFLASVLSDHLCKQGHSVRYFKTADLILELKLSKADGSYPKLRKQLTAFELLVLDEWLRDPLSMQEAREMLDILDERYRHASCVFVTQMPIEQWHPQIQDPTIADAILDRIVHDSMKVTLTGESMRRLTSKLTPPKAKEKKMKQQKDNTQQQDSQQDQAKQEDQ